jgi:hypothetical protein
VSNTVSGLVKATGIMSFINLPWTSKVTKLYLYFDNILNITFAVIGRYAKNYSIKMILKYLTEILVLGM